MEKAYIFDIQPFSVYDGPGIRTTVFLKGCNLRCRWCHNPESWVSKPELIFYESKCKGCGNCFKECNQNAHLVKDNIHIIDRKKCIICGKCADVCYSGAIMITGKLLTSESVFNKIYEEKDYYKNSNGGVTFSGGEAMLNYKFLKEILIMCKAEKIHTAIDTAGAVPFQFFEDIIPYTDLFLYDIKAFSSLKHKELTGVDNKEILKNYVNLIERGCNIWVRIPCIPNCNIDEMKDIAKFLYKYSPQRVELLAYHKLGESKKQALGLCTEAFEVPSIESMKRIQQIFIDYGVNAIYKN